MKIGDIVRQGDRVIKLKGIKRSKQLGIVVAIRDMPPARPEETKVLRQMMDMLGRQIDVLWENGKLTKGFAENSLDIVVEELTDEQLEFIRGGMSEDAFNLWRCEVLNDY